MLKYKGYIGQVEFVAEADILHGEVINTRDVITFEGKSISEIKKAFKESVDVYLDYCKRKKREPDKPFSGNFLVRSTPEKHRLYYTAARRKKMSLNRWADQTLQDAAKRSLEKNNKAA